MKHFLLAGFLLFAAADVLPAQSSPDINLTAREEQIVAASKMAAAPAQKNPLAPPLGWNSYDAFGDSVVESEVLSNALWMQQKLLPFGWDTIVVDFRWYDPQPTGDDLLLNKIRTGAALTADEFGRLLPATNSFRSCRSGRSRRRRSCLA